ncbi:MAG: glycine--tRNA ligase subunit beta [Synergistaceae bacterium]|nr:glycine--tRNA ligase subunit beta [Synergistaceae bacterium]
MTEKRDFLLEIGTEEIPARFMPWALEESRRLFADSLADAHIDYEEIITLGTPRRLAVRVKGLASKQEDRVEQYRGPLWTQAFDAAGNPTKAALGFARSKNVPIDELKSTIVNGQEYVLAEVRHEGRETVSLLPDICAGVIRRLVFPKNMYWDDPSIRYARPIRWIVALWGDTVLPFRIGSLESGRVTRGHRFMGDRSIEIPSPKEYMDLLFANFVIVDPAKRREKMLSAISAIEKQIGGKAELDPDLVEENLFLVEYPVPFSGSFDRDFLEIPEEVLTTSMKHHQKYFPVRDRSGKLLPHFIGVSNNQATSMNVVREGNERVLRARLSDAGFFWKEDRKVPLSERVEELKAIVYQERLGSVYEKAMRVRSVALKLAERVPGLVPHREVIDRAGMLAKADLVTSMVYEFPELKGVMGREYALQNGEDPDVALAIYEQVLPRFSGDALPTSPAGAVLGVVDRADSLVGCFKVGLAPTGSQDPYALRRAARNINEILWNLDLDIDLFPVFEDLAAALDAPKETLEAVRDFFIQRLQIQLREKGFSHGLVCLGVQLMWNRPCQVQKILNGYAAVLGQEWFRGLVTAAVRVKNILSKAGEFAAEVREEAFTQEEESFLHQAVSSLEPQVKEALSRQAWDEVTALLAKLEPSITRFFDKVLVMDENPAVRQNRLALLLRCQDLFMSVGDLGLLKE